MDVPAFREYFPSVETMSRRQREFYEDLEIHLDAGRAPDVAGNISYLFVYVYDVLGRYSQKDYQVTYDRLLQLAEQYAGEAKFAEYCRYWAYDCLLATMQYDRYLELTEPACVFGNATHQSNLRLNVQFHTARKANATDLVRLVPVRYTRTTKNYAGRFRDILNDVFDKASGVDGPWFDRMLTELGPNPKQYPHSLFPGQTTVQSKLAFDLLCFYTLETSANKIRSAARDAENMLRDELGDPRVGEGWVAESELYRAIADAFANTEVVQHGRPEWLGRQHFDIWLPRWNIAIERHGRQHFEAVDYFGGETTFIATQARDRRKARLALKHGVSLLVATESEGLDEVIAMVRAARLEQVVSGQVVDSLELNDDEPVTEQ